MSIERPIATTPAAQIIEALREIACGQRDRPQPLNREDARQIARRALAAAGVSWPGYIPRSRQPSKPKTETEE